MNLGVEAPLPEPEVHAVVADDGWRSYVYDFRPASDARGIVIAGHAMMVDAQTLCRRDRPTLVWILVRAGFRVLVPDLRGHGASGPLAGEGGDWSYDAIVSDVGSYVELARELAPRLPITLIGHSLFGHASLAWLGLHPDAPVRAVVLLACDLWNRRFESRRWRWTLKRMVDLSLYALVRAFGYLPVRKVRAGTADEARTYWEQFHTAIAHDRWKSIDGAVDYYPGLADIGVPVFHVLSEGDWLYANPRSALAFTATVPLREVLVLGRDDAPSDLRDYRPGHMEVVTSPSSAGVWWTVARWLGRQSAT
jgi:pimeloyl-ACP methyl ester carboxylesterase